LNSGRTRTGASSVNCGIDAGGKTLKICTQKLLRYVSQPHSDSKELDTSLRRWSK
jgi:hypothetical protein